MKRYVHTMYGGMMEHPTGEYIRHDDADLAALVEAAQEAAECLRRLNAPKTLRLSDNLRRALAAVAASGTTTRGGGEA